MHTLRPLTYKLFWKEKKKLKKGYLGNFNNCQNGKVLHLQGFKRSIVGNVDVINYFIQYE